MAIGRCALLVAAGASSLASSGCSASRVVADHETNAQLQAMASRQVALERRLELLESRLEALTSIKGVREAAAPRVAARAAAPAKQAGWVPANLSTVKVAPESDFSDSAPADDALAPILAGNSSASPEDQFDVVLGALSSGEHARGADAANTLADRFPRHARAPEVLLAAGLALLATGDLPVALWTLERVCQDYPRSPQAPDALVNRGLGQVRLERPGEAHALFSAVIERYPNTSAAGRARTELKNIAAGSDSAAAAQ